MTADEPIAVGVTGVGARGLSLLRRCADMDDVRITAVCDVQDRRLDAAADALADAERPEPERFHDHEEMLAGSAIDTVIIATSWRFHASMAMRAMEAGVVPAMDVGPASSLEECRELVRTAERTGTDCMLLENSCFGRDQLATLRMVRDGLFGTLSHCECGYCHDLRGRLNAVSGTSREDSAHVEDGDRYFRGIQHEHRNGDLYPTHGVGPMAACLDINHGNRFVSLSSFASAARGLRDWGERNLPPEHPSRDVEWAHGDVITTVIRCANGQTLTVTHDVNLPRADNSKRYAVRGTRGMWQEERDAVYVDDRSPDHEWESFDPYREAFEHPVWERYRAQGVEGGHGGADYLVLRAFFESVRQGVRPPVDVYDTATWRAISPLSEQSIAAGGTPISFPDFTNGGWMTDDPILGVTGDVGPDRLDHRSVLPEP